MQNSRVLPLEERLLYAATITIWSLTDPRSVNKGLKCRSFFRHPTAEELLAALDDAKDLSVADVVRDCGKLNVNTADIYRLALAIGQTTTPLAETNLEADELTRRLRTDRLPTRLRRFDRERQYRRDWRPILVTTVDVQRLVNSQMRNPIWRVGNLPSATPGLT